MDTLARAVQEQGRLISVEDAALVSELELRWSEARNYLKTLERKNCVPQEELRILRIRLEHLRRASHRLKQLTEADHRHVYGEVSAQPDGCAEGRQS